MGRRVARSSACLRFPDGQRIQRILRPLVEHCRCRQPLRLLFAMNLHQVLPQLGERIWVVSSRCAPSCIATAFASAIMRSAPGVNSGLQRFIDNLRRGLQRLYLAFLISDHPLGEPSVQELAQMLRPLNYPRNVSSVVSAVDTLEQAVIVERHCSASVCRLTDRVQLTHRVVTELLNAVANDPSSDVEIDLFLKKISAVQDSEDDSQ
jgi:hypothetical protein